MFSFLKGKKSENQCLGIAVNPYGISFALVNRLDDQLHLDSLAFDTADNVEDLTGLLKQLVSKHGLKGKSAVFVMHPQHYAVVQIESPEVAPEELKNAVRWRIKDLIDFHIDDAEIDLVPLPQGKRTGSPKLMYAVATKTSYVQSIAEAMQEAGLEINAIDITELALRNMTYADAEENRALALLYLSEFVSLIEICDNGSLCLSRHINLDVSRMDTDSSDGRSEILDILSLEIQRSLDYYESQFANGAAAKLNVISQIAIPHEEFQEVAGSYLTVPIEPLHAFDSLQGADHHDSKLLASCAPAIGAAIRNFAWTK